MLRKTQRSEVMCFKKTTVNIALLASILGLAAAKAQSPRANLKPADNSRTSEPSKAATPAASPSKYLVGESDVLHIPPSETDDGNFGSAEPMDSRRRPMSSAKELSKCNPMNSPRS
jgi:hypothetical protein